MNHKIIEDSKELKEGLGEVLEFMNEIRYLTEMDLKLSEMFLDILDGMAPRLRKIEKRKKRLIDSGILDLL